jgi:hypothetical protein
MLHNCKSFFNEIISLYELKIGAVNVQVVELPNAIKKVPIKWKKLKINLEDLAKPRWIDGLTIPQICYALARSRSTVQVSIRTLRNGGFSLLNLSELEKNLIKRAIIKEIIKYGIQGCKD